MGRGAPGAMEPIRVEAHQLFNPQLNYTYFLVVALLPTMLQIFVLVTSVYALGVELKEGTAEAWLERAGGSPWKAVAGKMLPYTIIFVFLGFFMIAFLFGCMGVPLRGSLGWIAVATLLFVTAYQAIGLALVSATANLRLSLNLAAFYASTAFTFVGITFPAVGMSLLARSWAAIIPLFYYLRILVDQGVRGVPVGFDLQSFTVLATFIFLLPAFALLRMGTLMTDRRYWGRQ